MGLYLVCDGGGSKTEFLLFNDAGQVFAFARGEGANANFLSAEKAAANVCGGISRCLEKAGVGANQLSFVWLFIPGFKSCVQMVQTFLGATPLQLTGDEKNAFYAALGQPEGIAVLAGTGSFASGRGRSGKSAVAGGWGPLFGDEGSGYHIGILCLSKLAWLHDRQLRGSRLEILALAALQAPDIISLRQMAYQPGFDRAHVAALCPVVAQAAAQGDAYAHEILDTAACCLARLAGTVADTIDEYDLPVALTGGVAHMGELFEKKFCAALAVRLPRCYWQRAKYDPVVGGALCLLNEAAGVSLADERIARNLIQGKNG